MFINIVILYNDFISIVLSLIPKGHYLSEHGLISDMPAPFSHKMATCAFPVWYIVCLSRFLCGTLSVCRVSCVVHCLSVAFPVWYIVCLSRFLCGTLSVCRVTCVVHCLSVVLSSPVSCLGFLPIFI